MPVSYTTCAMIRYTSCAPAVPAHSAAHTAVCHLSRCLSLSSRLHHSCYQGTLLNNPPPPPPLWVLLTVFTTPASPVFSLTHPLLSSLLTIPSLPSLFSTPRPKISRSCVLCFMGSPTSGKALLPDRPAMMDLPDLRTLRSMHRYSKGPFLSVPAVKVFAYL